MVCKSELPPPCIRALPRPLHMGFAHLKIIVTPSRFLQGQGQFEEEKLKTLNQKMKLPQPQGMRGKI